MKITIFKGTNNGIPPTINPITICGLKKIHWKIQTDSSMAYDMVDPDDEDELDWSKLLGVSFSPVVNARKNSVMIGWRYNDDTEKLEFNIYKHDKSGKRDFTKPLLDCIPGETIFVQFLINSKTQDFIVQLRREDQDASIRKDVSSGLNITKLAREINSWFGGNEKAPNKITFKKTKI